MFVEKKIIIGRFGKSHGLKGWLRVNSETQPENNILNYLPWYIAIRDEFKPLSIKDSNFLNNNLLVHIEGYDTRDAAKQLTGLLIFVEHRQLPLLSDQQYYWVDLEGLAVYTIDNHLLGIVDYMMEAGACDVMVIKRDNTEILVPFDKHNVVQEVNLKSGKIVVNWDPDDDEN